MRITRLCAPAAAALLGLLFGVQGSALAALMVTNGAGGDALMGSITYARETLQSDRTVTPKDSADTNSYYKLGGPDDGTDDANLRSHDVTDKAGIARADGDSYIVTYSLQGMVFASDLTASNLGTATVTEVADGPDTLGAVTPLTTASLSMGKEGDSAAVFRVMGSQAIEDDAYLVLDNAKFAITGSGAGSITRTVVNRSLEGLPGVPSTSTTTAQGIIKTAPALKVTVTPANLTAKVAEDFMNFGRDPSRSPMLKGSLGTVMVDTTSDLQDADAMSGAVSMADDILDTEATTTSPAQSTVTFGGNISFVKMFGYGNDATCTTITDVRKPSTSNPAVRTSEIVPTAMSMFEMSKALCVEVDGKTPIPATAPYTATFKYVRAAGTMPAMLPATHTINLGRIVRDGITVNIPFMVSQAGRYQQRISIVNMNPSAVSYSFEFIAPEAGTMVVPGAAATGMIPATTTAVLNTQDIMTVTGNVGRTAGTLNIAADGNIHVGISLVNKMDGSTTILHAHP